MARVTKDKCLEIINTFEPSKEGRRKGQLGIDGKSFICLSVCLSVCLPACLSLCLSWSVALYCLSTVSLILNDFNVNKEKR